MTSKRKQNQTRLDIRRVVRCLVLAATVCLLASAYEMPDREMIGTQAVEVGQHVLALAEHEIARRAGVGILADGGAQTFSIADAEAEIARLTNSERANAKLPALVANADLMRLARARSTDMAVRGYYDHFDPVTRARLPPPDAAENLDRVRPLSFDERLAHEIVADWMGSAPHRGNLLNAGYGCTGVGIAIDTSGMVYVTQLFK